MTSNPFTVEESASVSEAARIMRDQSIGDVLVARPDGTICGIVTDRDLALGVVAEDRDPTSMRVQDVCNHKIESIGSDDPVDEAVALMRNHAIRRLPVIDAGQLVGIVSLGDLAVERDPRSALADISEAPPNN
jgi:CBS domain-containing protein